MKIYWILLLHLLAVSVQGQETKPAFDGHTWKAPYTLDIPKNWTVERFLIPISFAPAIKYTGVEDIRFSPGWGQPTSKEYWSYAFLWYLEGTVQMDAAIIRKNLTAYYTGLVSVNGSNIAKEKIMPVEVSVKISKRAAGDISTYTGRIKMLDYMRQQPITLNCRVHLRMCAGSDNTFVFYELSPRPFSDKIWRALDSLWQQFICTGD